MKFGIDFHGVLNTHPDRYIPWMRDMMSHGHETHIITGVRYCDLDEWLFDHAGHFQEPFWTHFFSITDYHAALGTKIVWKEDKPYMDKDLWDRAKFEYCERKKIDFMLDDSPVYGQYFNGHTLYLLQHNPAGREWRSCG